MSDLTSNVHLVLRDGGYTTWNENISGPDVIGFEDEALLGFVCTFQTPQDLLRVWRDVETSLLNKHSARLREAGDKAWNVYSAFLTSGCPDDGEDRSIRWIEENLERTRKLAAANAVTRSDVENALLPLLPISSKPVLDAESTGERLTRRIQMIAPDVGEAALDERVGPIDVARRLASAS
jgi:hypothetical protein